MFGGAGRRVGTRAVATGGADRAGRSVDAVRRRAAGVVLPVSVSDAEVLSGERNVHWSKPGILGGDRRSRSGDVGSRGDAARGALATGACVQPVLPGVLDDRNQPADGASLF